jgi:hypothetical protein
VPGKIPFATWYGRVPDVRQPVREVAELRRLSEEKETWPDESHWQIKKDARQAHCTARIQASRERHPWWKTEN